MRPSDLPEFRARTVRTFTAANHRITQTLTEAKPPPKTGNLLVDTLQRKRATLSGEMVNTATRLRENEYGPPEALTHWTMAELFYVTSEMSALAGEAAKTMPDFTLQKHDLPAPIGALYLDASESAGTNDYEMMCLWGPDWASKTTDLMVTMYAVNRQDQHLIRLFAVHVGYGTDRIKPEPTMFETRTTGKTNVEGEWLSSVDWMRVLRCAWLLMQQQVATETVHRPDRASARRIARDGGAVDPVRVISLRRSAGNHASREAGREYVHRWVVRGHWRKQWYAKQERHVPIWIAPFIKGPDDAPLLGGEKVYAWRK